MKTLKRLHWDAVCILEQYLTADARSMHGYSCPDFLTGNYKLDKGNNINLGLFIAPADTAAPFMISELAARYITGCAAARAAGCLPTCIGIACGHYAIGELSAARWAAIKRAVLLAAAPELVADLIRYEASRAARAAAKAGHNVIYIRLDGTSDIKTTKTAALLRAAVVAGCCVHNVAVELYDYTKLAAKALQGLPEYYRGNICFSLWGRYLTDPALLATQWQQFSYFSLVCPAADKQGLIDQFRAAGIRAVDGDLFDTYTDHQAIDGLPVVLLLSAKGIKNTSKQQALNSLFSADIVETMTTAAALAEELI